MSFSIEIQIYIYCIIIQGAHDIENAHLKPLHRGAGYCFLVLDFARWMDFPPNLSPHAKSHADGVEVHLVSGVAFELDAFFRASAMLLRGQAL